MFPADPNGLAGIRKLCRESALTSISLITATLNSGRTLEDALRSVKRQGIEPEHIIVDGGSNDETPAIIDRMRHQVSRVVAGQDRGIYDALNKGIKVATGEVVGFLHADDVLADDNVLTDIARTLSDPAVDAVYGDLRYVGRQNLNRTVRLWRTGDYSPQALYRGWMPPHPTFFVRRDCYEKYGLYRLDLGSAADYELMLRFLLVHDIRVKYIPRVLVKMRVGGASNVSLGARLKANRMDRKAWEVNGLRPYPWTLVAKPLRKIGQWWAR